MNHFGYIASREQEELGTVKLTVFLEKKSLSPAGC